MKPCEMTEALSLEKSFSLFLKIYLKTGKIMKVQPYHFIS